MPRARYAAAMARRSALADDDLPPIVVEGCWSADVGLPAGAGVCGGRLDVGPPGAELVRRLSTSALRARRRYNVAIGAHRGCDPRMRSSVEHRLARPAEEVLDALLGGDDLRVEIDGLLLAADLREPRWDSFEHEHRLPAELYLAWSWPHLPMWLAVGELSRTTSALRLSLRSRRRLRYPARYFHAAHTALGGIGARVDAIAG